MSRPSPALVIAMVALFVALGGTGYAAMNLPKNSVSAKQIKKNAVTAAKLKKNAVTTAKVKNKAITGAKLNLAKLGTVPSATNAQSAAVASSLTPPEATRLVGTPGQPPFAAGAANLPGEGPFQFTPVGFFKDHEGVVHLSGAGLATGSPPFLFSLPPGYRPAAGKVVLAFANENPVFIFGSNVTIEGMDLSGTIFPIEGGAVLLDSVTFRAES